MNQKNDIQKLWASASVEAGLVQEKDYSEVIRLRIKSERKMIMQYYWSSFIYQMILYALATHLMITNWGNLPVMALCIGIITLYVPFTFIQRARFKKLCLHSPGSANAFSNTLSSYVNGQYKMLSSFYRFKIWYDRLVVPVILLLIVALIYCVYVPGGLAQHLPGAIVVYLLILSGFLLVLHSENRKRFKEPLQEMRLIMEDLD